MDQVTLALPHFVRYPVAIGYLLEMEGTNQGNVRKGPCGIRCRRGLEVLA